MKKHQINYIKNKDYFSQYGKDNKEEIAKKKKIYYELHKEEISAKKKLYYQNKKKEKCGNCKDGYVCSDHCEKCKISLEKNHVYCGLHN